MSLARSAGPLATPTCWDHEKSRLIEWIWLIGRRMNVLIAVTRYPYSVVRTPYGYSNGNRSLNRRFAYFAGSSRDLHGGKTNTKTRFDSSHWSEYFQSYKTVHLSFSLRALIVCRGENWEVEKSMYLLCCNWWFDEYYGVISHKLAIIVNMHPRQHYFLSLLKMKQQHLVSPWTASYTSHKDGLIEHLYQQCPDHLLVFRSI